MLSRQSNVTEISGTFVPEARNGRDNAAWVEDATKDGAGAQCHLILLGGRDALAVRLRVAQSHLRSDMTPSHWSHALLRTTDGDCHHVPVGTELGTAFPPATNGVQPVDMTAFADPVRYPNVAVVRVPYPAARGKAPADEPTTVESAVKSFTRHRGQLDAVELLWLWQGFVWGVGKSGNPLLQGHGIPSAVFVEQVLMAVGLDITPGLASSASCPEAIWQSVRWWYGYYRIARNLELAGKYCVDDRLVPDTFGASAPPAKPVAPAKATGKKARRR